MKLPPARRGRGLNRVRDDSASPSDQVTPDSGSSSASSRRPSPLSVSRDPRRPTGQRAQSRSRGTVVHGQLVKAPESSESLLPMYRQAVVAGAVGFHQVDPRTWVAQACAWPDPIPVLGLEGWMIIESELDEMQHSLLNCSGCPDFAPGKPCVHVLLLRSSESLGLHPVVERDDSACVMFLHERAFADGPFVTLFVVSIPQKGREVVSHAGLSPRRGDWACRKCKNKTCPHIGKAKKHPAFLHIFEQAGSEASGDSGEDNVGETPIQRAERLSSEGLREERSVSYLPVGPPDWAKLPTDTAPSFPPVYSNPGHLALGDNPRCKCGSGPNLDKPSKVIGCVVYSSIAAFRTTIEVRACSTCHPASRQFAGPDLRALGLFNFNNTRVYTHELLDGFTNSMTATETPFHSYHKIVQRKYKGYSAIPFVSNRTFRTVWFSFTRIQQLGDSFTCDTCGPEPAVVILDGVTAGFGAKHETGSLRPPTLPDQSSISRSNIVVPQERLTFIMDDALRRKAQKAVRWRRTLTKTNKSKLRAQGEDNSESESSGDERDDADADDESDDAGEVPDEDVNATAAGRLAGGRRQQRDRADALMRASIPQLAAQLAPLNHGLAVLFGVHVACNYRSDMEDITKLYLDLLEQVLAYESAIQFAPPASWPHISLVSRGDAASADALLPLVPALARVAKHELSVYDNYTDHFRDLCKFVVERAQKVSAVHPTNNPDDARISNPVVEDWRETGCFYGRPRIRNRPVYPHLPTDRKADRATVSDGGGTIGCSKYYQLYGRKGLTGGLMVAWCTHSCCIGFHCIPRGEGRNDVFSALFCYWEKAPEFVIYDFSCALASYCMLRESQFFRHTRFLIDIFHSKGHTRCSRACFLSAYRDYSSKLRGLNSSAGESGNAGLLRIRKPLSYMTQRRAVIFSYVFLAVWNRTRRLKLAGKKF